jgi:hypothetical protein
VKSVPDHRRVVYEGQVPTRRALLYALVLLMVTTAPAAAQVYRWTDDDGVINLTTDESRIPEKYRDRTDKLEASPRDVVDSPSATAPTLQTTPGSALVTDATMNGIPFTLLVDTGAARTVIAPAVLLRAGIDPTRGRPIGLVGVGGSVKAIEVVVPRLDLAGVQIGPTSIVALEIPGLSTDGLLGRDVLEHFVLTVDPLRGRATLTR